MISVEEFKLVVKNAPLFSIDLVILNEFEQLLFGKRLNAPAKNWWFVPGGRVYKNEPLDSAFKRISSSELATEYSINRATFIGLYDHFYQDSAFDDSVSTHYINAAHLLKVNSSELKLPIGEQHHEYRWVNIHDVIDDASIHQFSKIFLKELISNTDLTFP